MKKEKRTSRLTERTLLWAAVIMGVCGCAGAKPVVMERVTVRADTVYRERVRADTVRVTDSVRVWQWAKGDTVFVEKTAWRWRDRVTVRTDTVYRYVACMDSARVEQPFRYKNTGTGSILENFAGYSLCAIGLMTIVAGAVLYGCAKRNFKI